MIVSFIDGRIRLRHEALKIPAIAERARDAIISLKGVIDVVMNHRAGSMLIIYDSNIVKSKDMRQKLVLFMGLTTEDKSSLGYPRKMVNAGMLASLIVSLLGAAAGKTAVHTTAGLLFLGFAAFHVYKLALSHIE